MMKVVFFFRLAFDLGKRLKGFKYDDGGIDLDVDHQHDDVPCAQRGL